MADDQIDKVRDELEERLGWVFEELTRLRKENKRLLEENKELREEVTLSRLQNGTEVGAEVEPPEEASPSAISLAALTFYHNLPPSFKFDVYFELAGDHGLDGRQAKDYLLLFMSEGMLTQKGSRIEKPDYTVDALDVA